MPGNRRQFLSTLGTGLATAGAISTASATVTTKTPRRIPLPKGARKLIIRGDDVGHSEICNIGAFEALDHGVVTCMDVMLDSPGTEDALRRLRAYPWISVGWHMHMWGKPVLPAARVPTLVEKSGKFEGRFRTDMPTANDVSAEEIDAELRAQLTRCRHILGRVPVTGKLARSDTIYGRVVNRINEEFGIASGYSSQLPKGEMIDGKLRAVSFTGFGAETRATTGGTINPGQASEKWADRKIFVVDSRIAFQDLETDNLLQLEANYDPVLFYTEDRAGILRMPADYIPMQAWHPGTVDFYVWQLGDRAPRPQASHYVLSRTRDVIAMCDPRLKAWIRQNRIELVNQSDALFGKRDYQEHLRQTGSELAVA